MATTLEIQQLAKLSKSIRDLHSLFIQHGDSLDSVIIGSKARGKAIKDADLDSAVEFLNSAPELARVSANIAEVLFLHFKGTKYGESGDL